MKVLRYGGDLAWSLFQLLRGFVSTSLCFDEEAEDLSRNDPKRPRWGGPNRSKRALSVYYAIQLQQGIPGPLYEGVFWPMLR